MPLDADSDGVPIRPSVILQSLNWKQATTVPTFTAHASTSIYFTCPGKNSLIELLDIQWVIEGNTGTATDGDRNVSIRVWNIHVGHDGSLWTPHSRYVVAGYDISKAPFHDPDGSARPLCRSESGQHRLGKPVDLPTHTCRKVTSRRCGLVRAYLVRRLRASVTGYVIDSKAVGF